jgi:hypothetical protein
MQLWGSEVQDMKPKPHQTSGGCKMYDHAPAFNCICHRGVAAIAGRDHLVISNNIGWKGGSWPHPKQHHPALQGPPFSSIYWPPELHRQSHLNYTCTASSMPKYTNVSRPCCYTAPTRAHLISFGGGATPPHCIYIHIIASRPAQQYLACIHCLINLTFDSHREHLAVFKCHTVPNIFPPIAEVQSFAPSAKHVLVMLRSTEGNKISINAHCTHCQ